MAAGFNASANPDFKLKFLGFCEIPGVFKNNLRYKFECEIKVKIDFWNS